jgi:23S rRNA (adenine2030-N6)-methyltransferase
MNYRHAYHAGNFADCFKHAILVWLLNALARKEKPFCVLDTHAGTGAYDLRGAAAQRTGEAQRGILRLLDSNPPNLKPYLALVPDRDTYPGSPAIIRALLRPGDRAIACELHPDDFSELRRRLLREKQFSVHLRDGYEAVGAFLPPAERRGLTLIDPPYEDADEFLRVAAALRLAKTRFAGGVVAAWYPIKHLAPVRAFFEDLRASRLRDVVTAEFLLREPLDPARLNGCGMVVVNPPFRFEEEISKILAALLEVLGDREAGENACVRRVADE